MAEEPREKAQSWWATLPGILTAVAGLVTAVTALVAALHQVGLIGGGAGPSSRAQTTASSAQSAAGPEVRVPSAPGRAAAPSPGTDANLPRQLAAGTEVQLASAGYKLMAVRLARHNTEELALTFTIRMTNNERYPANFWDASFRLLVDGVPRAPTSNLNKLVEGQSAGEGDVVFVIPATAGTVALRVIAGEAATEIPVDLSGNSRDAGQKK